ncbi:MAG: aldo/keto reductase [Alphaproteobacteria bacterium]|nr:aldo/keto reductase [Alphaproteobacteria bacterium]
MPHRALGATGIRVSALCLGTMSFGARTSFAEAGRITAAARDAGINFIDTADVNAGGDSERTIGRLVRCDRTRWVLATKFGNRFWPGPNRAGLGRKWLMESLHTSLRRLATDTIDLFYLDWDDASTPLDETVWTLGQAIHQGAIRAWGFSNFAAWRIPELIAVSDRLGVDRPIAAQPCYNALTRTAEAEYLPACRHFGIGVVPYSPLARGVLTAKYQAGRPPPRGSRAWHRDARLFETEYRGESLRLAGALKTYAESRGMTAVEFAVAWLLNNEIVTSVVAGPRTRRQWMGYLTAPARTISPEDEAFVDGLVAPGSASTPGYRDPRSPVAGRVPRSDPSVETSRPRVPPGASVMDSASRARSRAAR